MFNPLNQKRSGILIPTSKQPGHDSIRWGPSATFFSGDFQIARVPHKRTADPIVSVFSGISPEEQKLRLVKNLT